MYEKTEQNYLINSDLIKFQCGEYHFVINM